jgi:hypothetical protein
MQSGSSNFSFLTNFSFMYLRCSIDILLFSQKPIIMEHRTDVDCVWDKAKKFMLEKPIKQRVCANGACVNLDEPVKALLSHLYRM